MKLEHNGGIIRLSRFVGGSLTGLFILLAMVTNTILWRVLGWHVGSQALVIFFVALIGEHYVSGKGYYNYTQTNGYFIGRVPLWIPFMWIVAVQGGLVFSLIVGFSGFEAAWVSGWICILVDFVFIEPYLCSQKCLWLWNPVINGYFAFIPSKFNRFTAPPGNYLVWLGFPSSLNAILLAGSIMFA